MPAGRPLKYNKDFHPQDFIRLSKQGKTLMQISLAWDVERETIYDWGRKYKEFSDAVKKGRQFAESWYANLGQMAMLGEASIMENGRPKKVAVNLGFFCWMTKNLFQWSDKTEQKDTTPVSKKKVKVEVDIASQVKDILAQLKDEY